jgi:hypothetical protein
MANAIAKHPSHVWVAWEGIKLTRADAWVTVATLASVVILSLAGVFGAVALASNPNASLLVPIILGATAPTVVTLLNFANSRNTARKVDELRSTTQKIDEQTNGGLSRNVETAVHAAVTPAVHQAFNEILAGHTRRAHEPHLPSRPLDEEPPSYR